MNEKFLTKTPVVWLGALICCGLWGSAFPCIKLGYQFMNISNTDTACQILYAGCRFTLSGIFAIIIGSIAQKKIIYPHANAIPKVIWLSLLQTVLQYLFFYIGLAHTTGVKASIVDSLNVFIAIIIAGYMFRQEKVTLQKIIGCVIGFVGVVLVNITGTGLDASFTFTGEGFIFLSTVAYAFSSVFLKKYSKTENPVMLSGYQFVLGGIIMIVCGAALGGRFDTISTNGIAMLIWLATVSAVAYSLWGILLKYNPVSKVTIFGFLTPVFGVSLSAILLNESNTLGVKCVIALILVCIGILTVNSHVDNRM